MASFGNVGAGGSLFGFGGHESLSIKTNGGGHSGVRIVMVAFGRHRT